MARVCQLTDDPSGPTVQADCYEGLFWKSHATAELVAKMENAEYVLHQPFNRQIKKMAQGAFRWLRPRWMTGTRLPVE